MNTLRDLTIDQLQELYGAELQLKMLVEKMAYKTNNENLRHLFEEYSMRRESQLTKLEEVFGLLGISLETKRYSLIAEAVTNEVQRFMETNPVAEVLDAGFIAMFQKGIHYEVAMYGTMMEYANQIENTDARTILEEILREEKSHDRALTEAAKAGVNERALNPPSISY